MKVEADGTLTNSPTALYGPIAGTMERNSANGTGALRTFGEHKGSGLAFMCEILAGCLTGGGTSGPIPGGKRGQIANGMLSIYLSPGSFGTAGVPGTAIVMVTLVLSAAGLPLARRLGSNARLGRILFAGLILVVAAYVAVRAILVL